MSLLALQRNFGAWLREGDERAAAAVGSDYRPGLDVHLNNYRVNLVAGLSATFAQTLAWLGEDAFRDAVATYAGRVPPSSWTLDAYGRDFPAALETLFPEEPEIGELARLEWALAEAFVGPDHDAADAASLASIDWDRAVLRFTPTLRLLDVRTNVFELWSALASEAPPPPAAQLPETRAQLVFRAGQICEVRPADALEAATIRLCLAGATFSDACEALVASQGEEHGVALAGTMLGRWLSEGLIASAA